MYNTTKMHEVINQVKDYSRVLLSACHLQRAFSSS